MMFFSDFHFLRPAWLGLAPIVILIWWWSRRAQDPVRGWRAVMDTAFLAALSGDDHVRNRWRGIGWLVASLLAMIAMAGPTWRPELSPFVDDPAPVMILLKASQSMNSSDFSPSRMERARLKVADLAELRGGQPVGLVAYAGSAHLVLPPTRDFEVVATMATEIGPAIMPESGDALADALQLAGRTLRNAAGSIVVVTDGVEPGSQTSIAEFRAENRLPIFFLAVARPGSAELDAIERVAAGLRAHVTVITADREDVESLAKRAARAPLQVAENDDKTRWAEAGWWLVPVVAVFFPG